MEELGIRLNKYLSEAGVCSRREADRLIGAGRVTVDGELPPMGAKDVYKRQPFLCWCRRWPDGNTFWRPMRKL